MHIPDGYLSPQTGLTLWAVMLPIWKIALGKVKKTLQYRSVPLMALGAAFSFVVMMFNIPIPGGTTGHAVGATLLAIILGPWAACICITVVLVIQALLFGDGGVWAIGANSLNMAFIMPFVGYYLYKLLSKNGSKNVIVAGIISSYVAINVAAMAAAVEFGLQPLLFHTAAGVPLYCPYGLNIAIPAMAFDHLLFAGPIEAVATGLVIAFLLKSDETLLNQAKTINVYAEESK